MGEHAEKRRLTRGGLIKVGAAAALAAGSGGAGRALAGGGHSLPTEATLSLPMLRGGPAYLRHETFVPLVGSSFHVHRPELRPLRVKLVEATRQPSRGGSFSLLFRGRAGAAIAQGTHRIEHPALGAFELFVTPVGRGVRALNLEAVINRTDVGGFRG